jgi:hypothetical protein
MAILARTTCGGSVKRDEKIDTLETAELKCYVGRLRNSIKGYMMIKIGTLIIALSLLCCSPSANADNIDGWLADYVCEHSPVLHKIEIRKDGKGIVKVRAFGAGYPDDIDWGESVAEVYKDRFGSAPNFIAKFSIPKAKQMLVLAPNSGGGKPHSGGLVIGELYTIFLDGREPEYVRQNFQTPATK